MALSSRNQNNFSHPLSIPHHIKIGEVQNTKPQSRQTRISPIIGDWIMRVAIHFDGEPDRRAKEIDDRLGFQHHMLPPKLEAAELAIGERTPHALLGLCGITPHFMRAFQQLCFGHAGLPHPNPSPEGEGLRSAATIWILPLPTVFQSLFLINRQPLPAKPVHCDDRRQSFPTAPPPSRRATP